jgi:hydroxymethylbilane synthase
VLLACAGLSRLGLGARITEARDVERCVPAIGQGVIGIECRQDDARTRERLAVLDDRTSAIRLAAERALNARLGGACTVPVAGHARLDGDTVRLVGLVAAPDGRSLVRDRIEGPAARASALGSELAERLLARGGREILRAIGVEA